MRLVLFAKYICHPLEIKTLLLLLLLYGSRQKLTLKSLNIPMDLLKRQSKI